MVRGVEVLKRGGPLTLFDSRRINESMAQGGPVRCADDTVLILSSAILRRRSLNETNPRNNQTRFYVQTIYLSTRKYLCFTALHMVNSHLPTIISSFLHDNFWLRSNLVLIGKRLDHSYKRLSIRVACKPKARKNTFIV